ncbi:MAG: AAA family ATPase [Phycisphaerales bacterium JB063]
MTDPSPKQALLTPEELEPASSLARRVLEAMDTVLLGQHELHHLVLVGILSRGHILLEGMPGVGKTAMINALGNLMSLDFQRVQFTPDLMPGDIVGSAILQEQDNGKRQMVFEPGPIFTHILLADEINRASPKTQSAMLEAMQEQRVTTLGVTRPLPSPFFVLASQNPIDLEGTYPLPEAQLDRFLFKIQVQNPPANVIEDIIANRRRGRPPTPEPVVDAIKMDMLFAAMDRIFLPRPVASYIARLVSATHPGQPGTPKAVETYVTYGASPRAAIAIAEAARAQALIAGRPTAGFEDVKAVAPAVLNHRMILNYQARFDKIDPVQLVTQLLDAVDTTGVKLPAGVEVSAAQ